MRYSYLLFLLSVLFHTTGYGQVPKGHTIIYGNVCNAVTRTPIKNAQVILSSAGNTPPDTTYTGNMTINETSTCWHFIVPKKEGDYKLRFSAEGYETKEQKIHFKPKGRKLVNLIGSILLDRKREIKLKEATVKATKIKIYSKKDTLVFNADAFQLAEGSMLDALIRQLPGVELKDNGQILVNGKQVESLLLNGEEFFRNDRSVMLDNLPSYMVNNVQVYEKSSRLSEAMGREADQKNLVMDVKLKKQYAIGWIANAEAGMGTENRYMGRAFALRFTPQSRLSLFGNMNNINESRKPGQNGDWSPSNMPAGLDAAKTLGLDYQVKDLQKRFEVSGSAQITHQDRDNNNRQAGENFLPEGNTYSRSWNRSYSCNTKFNTQHFFFFKRKNINLWLQPALNYHKWDNRSFSLSATFAEKPDRYIGTGLMDSIMAPNAGNLMRQLALNRTLSNTLSDGHQLGTSLTAQSLISFNTSNDFLQLTGNADYTNRKESRFNHYRLDYPVSASTSTDFRNRWYKDYPNRNYSYSLEATYWYWIDPRFSIMPFYRFEQKFNDRDYALYRLDQLAGWGNGTEHAPGALPSETDWLQSTVDPQNSYRNYLIETGHRTGLQTKWEGRIKNKGYLYTHINLPVRMQRKRLDYERAGIDTLFSRNATFFEPDITVKYNWHNWNREASFRYYTTSASPNPTLLLNVQDNSNPLDISFGNPHLKNVHTHTLQWRYKNNSPRKQRFFSANLNYSITQNAIAWGYIYDKTTGIKTSMPENVNGNYSLTGGINYSMPLDKAKRLNMSTSTSAQFYNNVDLISVENVQASTRSVVQTLYLGETLKLDYRINKLKLGTKLGGTWTHAASRRQDFETVDAANFNYGLTAQVELPWNMQLYTDLTMYSRRGYEDHGMNTDDLVWNARLSKRVMKGNLTFILDGFDILHNLSNVTRSLNGQGRVETYRNVIPRYVMLHAVYRLNIKPKKRPGE